jgi:pyruvate,water dikinase
MEALPAPDVIMGDRAVVNLRVDAADEGLQRIAPGQAPEDGTSRNRGEPDEAGALQGVAVSSGKASGAARLIRHPREGPKLKRGEVLVAPSTDPAWTPLFLRASAVVMEVGGYLSHGAIVAREYGIPAVVNVAGAMTAFKDGDLLHVDGDSGKVRAPKQ